MKRLKLYRRPHELKKNLSGSVFRTRDLLTQVFFDLHPSGQFSCLSVVPLKSQNLLQLADSKLLRLFRKRVDVDFSKSSPLRSCCKLIQFAFLIPSRKKNCLKRPKLIPRKLTLTQTGYVTFTQKQLIFVLI